MLWCQQQPDLALIPFIFSKVELLLCYPEVVTLFGRLDVKVQEIFVASARSLAASPWAYSEFLCAQCA